MKKIIVMLMALVAVVCFVGCAANDKVYGVGKAVYGVGKAAAPLVPMNDAKREQLEKIDNVAGKYDEARTTVRDMQDGKKQDADTSEVSDK